MKPLAALDDEDEIHPFAIQEHSGVLVVPVHHDLYKATLDRLAIDVLEKIQATGIYRILMDMSGIALVDSYAFERLEEIVKIVGLMGGRVFVVGIQPGVASALVTMGVDVDGIDTVVDIRAGYRRFQDEEARAAPEMAHIFDDDKESDDYAVVEDETHEICDNVAGEEPFEPHMETE